MILPHPFFNRVLFRRTTVFLWALYLPDYPNLNIEVAIGDRYKPDVIALDAAGKKPIFWGESGQVGAKKINALVRRYRNTHFAIAKWNTRLDAYAPIIMAALTGISRGAPFDLIRFPNDSRERFIDDEGNIRLTHADVEWRRFG